MIENIKWVEVEDGEDYEGPVSISPDGKVWILEALIDGVWVRPAHVRRVDG